jgi:putative transposase
MKRYLDSQRSWLEVEPLPSYSPDLNPVEAMWGNVKGQELANRCGLFFWVYPRVRQCKACAS